MVSSIVETTPIITPRLHHIWRNGRTSVPVRPSLSVYARFKHIIGVPSRDKSTQISFFKLRFLDNLIDRLSIGKGGKSVLDVLPNFNKITDKNIEPIIKNLQEELRNQVVAQKPFFTGLFPETGMLFNISA